MQSKKISSPHLQILLRVAVLAAMDVLLMNYLGIHTQYFKIGFSFVPIALCGMLYGAKWSTACAGLGDLINCLLGPYGWYPPLTLSACLNGFLFGFFLKGRSDRLGAIIAAVVTFQLGVSLLLNTWFLSLLYSTPFLELMLTRVPQVLLMLPIQIIVLRLIGSKRLVTALAGTAA